jgi:hypothetical protein
MIRVYNPTITSSRSILPAERFSRFNRDQLPSVVPTIGDSLATWISSIKLTASEIILEMLQRIVSPEPQDKSH